PRRKGPAGWSSFSVCPPPNTPRPSRIETLGLGSRLDPLCDLVLAETHPPAGELARSRELVITNRSLERRSRHPGQRDHLIPREVPWQAGHGSRSSANRPGFHLPVIPGKADPR